MSIHETTKKSWLLYSFIIQPLATLWKFIINCAKLNKNTISKFTIGGKLFKVIQNCSKACKICVVRQVEMCVFESTEQIYLNLAKNKKKYEKIFKKYIK